jgi:hypothetical protein
VGFVAMVQHRGEFERMDGWGWLSVAGFAAAAALGVRRWPILRWLLASVPFWIFGNANELLQLTAVGLTIAALAAGAVGPTLVGRRVRRAGSVPLPHLASGPLVPVAPRTFTGGQRSQFLRYAAIALVTIALLLSGLWAAGYDAAVTLGLGLSAVILSATFAFTNWFASRVRLRIDESGVHGRTLLREHTARWSDISGLRLRYVFLPGYGIRLVYYVVETPAAEVSFPSSMRGARELQATIETATGLRWSEPEITPTM